MGSLSHPAKARNGFCDTSITTDFQAMGLLLKEHAICGLTSSLRFLRSFAAINLPLGNSATQQLSNSATQHLSISASQQLSNSYQFLIPNS